MPRPAGLPKTGGRKKGVPNKATREFREHIKALLDGAAEKFPEWLKAVPDEKKLELVSKLAEYVSPKLGRTEVTGEGGGPLVVEILKVTE